MFNDWKTKEKYFISAWEYEVLPYFYQKAEGKVKAVKEWTVNIMAGLNSVPDSSVTFFVFGIWYHPGRDEFSLENLPIKCSTELKPQISISSFLEFDHDSLGERCKHN